MNQTHILVQLTDKICDVAVYNQNGGVAFIGTLDVIFDGKTPYQGNTRKLKVSVHEAIVRYITRSSTHCDIGASTPLFVL